ncbi:MAG: Na/Pi cotransporter family protein, partial [Opitutae bacterium]|nr:Na/Pi cotransporter family protein [Opitutae bacterium]
IEQLNSFGFFSILIFVVLGVILTIMVQSSSAAMGITIILSANGWINFEIAAAIVLGENIGTTITAWLASIGTSITAKRAARAHFIFNIAGVLWMLILFYPFTSFVNELMPGAIYTSEISDIDAKDYLTKKGLTSESFTDEEIVAAKKSIVDSNIPLHLSMFHTLFNLCNICLLIWFSPNIARLAERLVREKT